MATKPITTGTRLTIEEFLDLPDTELREKMELDDGELYIMPRPRSVHQFLAVYLFLHIANYIDSFADPPASVFVDHGHHPVPRAAPRPGSRLGGHPCRQPVSDCRRIF